MNKILYPIVGYLFLGLGCFFLGFSWSVYGQDHEKAEFSEKAVIEIAVDDGLLLNELKGLVFINRGERVIKEGRSGMVGIQAEDIQLLKTSAFDKLMKSYLGKPVDAGSLNKLTQDVIVFCLKNHHPTIHLNIPEQNIDSGVIQVVVREDKVNEAKLEENH